jgi:endonuclease IV
MESANLTSNYCGGIGTHVSKKGRSKKSRRMDLAIAEDVKYMKDYGLADPSVQIFVVGPKTRKETLSADEKAGIRVLCDRGLKLVIHGAYIDRPWGESADAVQSIQLELKIAHEIGANGVIVHLGPGAKNDAATRRVLTEIGRGLESHQPILWLEIQAAKTSEFTYETPEKLAHLFDRIKGYGLNYTCGLCIDTAHLFSCGTSLETRAAAADWLGRVEMLLQNVPLMLHLNDSARELGCGIDKHAVLCGGTIWSAYHPTTGTIPFEMSGLNYILGWAEKKKIVTILERDDEDLHKDLTLVTQLGFK